MDSGSFYGGYGPPSSFSSFARPSDQNPGYSRMNHFDSVYSGSPESQLAINQKIDRLTRLIEDQTRETKELKIKFDFLKEEMDRHIKDVPDSSCSSSTASSTPKRLPLELSVSCVGIFIRNIYIPLSWLN